MVFVDVFHHKLEYKATQGSKIIWMNLILNNERITQEHMNVFTMFISISKFPDLLNLLTLKKCNL